MSIWAALTEEANPLEWLRWQWFKATHAHEEVGEGFGYTGPDRNFIMRCCRCGKRRLFGFAVEMYGPSPWWHECLQCALATTERIHQRMVERYAQADEEAQG